ncbi:sigma-70 family RNA polymerase sigma factor [Sporosarcina highlanderae]|uniref:Sigma-70 family RNA polymerase sigma factor n=1 Tax=Sporosarcina highlanderae TaxID=3035916 RepID=A0ABT8JVE3_9BACL|nr:sigma-70 family RNA polymerase sigma factor [Sporosarcina highlanderae]MDN4609144.1 sigma-70 family RNA polymerase sigma factor [Sporosarcina highlanderae]
MTKLIDDTLHTRESIVKQYTPLVYKHARNLCRSDYEYYMHDLAQEGFIGLLYAFDRYDPDSGFKFVTFAQQYIRGYMLRLHDKSHFVRVPIHVIRLAWQIERSIMWTETDDVIAKHFEATEFAVAGARKYFDTRHAVNIENPLGDDGGLTILDTLQYNEDLSSVFIEEFTKKLNPREMYIIQKLYEGYSQSEIAPTLGISRTRVGHILIDIRNKLRTEGVM